MLAVAEPPELEMVTVAVRTASVFSAYESTTVFEFPEPVAGETVSQGAEVTIVQFPVEDTLRNWLPASPDTFCVLMLTVGGTSGSSLLVPEVPPQDAIISDSARSAVTDPVIFEISRPAIVNYSAKVTAITLILL